LGIGFYVFCMKNQIQLGRSIFFWGRKREKIIQLVKTIFFLVETAAVAILLDIKIVFFGAAAVRYNTTGNNNNFYGVGAAFLKALTFIP